MAEKYIQLADNLVDATTPELGKIKLYLKNKKLYTKDSDGIVVDLTAIATVTEIVEGSGLKLNYREITADYTLLDTDYTVNVTANNVTITLPSSPISNNKTQIYQIKNTGTGLVTIATTGGATIDGDVSESIMLLQYENLTIQSTGTNWIIL